jgi:hypothetical protein
MKFFFSAVLLVMALSTSALAQTPSPQVNQKTSTEEEVLRTEREQRDAVLKRDIKTTERLVADEFVMNTPSGRGSKATLLQYVGEEPADPTLTLTAEDVLVKVNGDTAIVVGKRVEKRQNPDNKAWGTAYARYTRTYIKRCAKSSAPSEAIDSTKTGGACQWQLLAEQMETIPGERTAIKVDPAIYDDYVGKYDSAIMTFSVVREGDRLRAIPDDKRRAPMEIFPESESQFFLKGVNAQITFMRNRQGQVTHAVVRLNGADFQAKRMG